MQDAEGLFRSAAVALGHLAEDVKLAEDVDVGLVVERCLMSINRGAHCPS